VGHSTPQRVTLFAYVGNAIFACREYAMRLARFLVSRCKIDIVVIVRKSAESETGQTRTALGISMAVRRRKTQPRIAGCQRLAKVSSRSSERTAHKQSSTKCLLCAGQRKCVHRMLWNISSPLPGAATCGNLRLRSRGDLHELGLRRRQSL